MMLGSERSFALIIQDQDLGGFGALDLSTILSSDPVLQELPTIRYSGGDLRLPWLLTAVRDALHPRFPSDGPSPSDTRFVRRRRSTMVPAIA